MKSIIKDERGMSHVLMILLAVLVLGGVGYVGWTVMNKDKSSKSSSSKALSDLSKTAEKECNKELDDKDICKYFGSWSDMKKFAIVSTSTGEGTTSSSTMKVDGDKTYMKMDGEFAMEVITIGDTTYTKAGETWWKQTAKKLPESTPKVDKEEFKPEEPVKDQPEAEQTKYVKVGKEACGKLTCFKYQVVDPSNTDSTEFIWFDDEDYLTRKTRTEGKDGSVDESSYSYDNISVTAPTPVKELGENQYIMPGQSEPQTMPSAADFEM